MTATEERTARQLALDVFVPGAAAPKGSARSFVVGGRTTPVRAVTVPDNKVPARAWASQVSGTVYDAWSVVSAAPGSDGAYDRGPTDQAVTVELDFVMPRRKSAPKRSTPAHTRKPDLDKLARNVLDALRSIVYGDDAQVDDLHPTKREAEPGETPGCRIRIYVRPTEE